MNQQSDHARSTGGLPAHCTAKLRSLVTSEIFDALCYQVTFKGMRVCSPFVPQHGEAVELTDYPPDIGGRPSEPFVTRVEVVACTQIRQGQLYELTVNIVSNTPTPPKPKGFRRG